MSKSPFVALATVFAGSIVVAQGCGAGVSLIGPKSDGGDTDSGGTDSGVSSNFPDSNPPNPTPMPDQDAGCTTVYAKHDPIYLLLIADGSGSTGANNKWEAQKAALDIVFDDMLARQDEDLGVGLIVFSDANDSTMGYGPYPSSADVFVGYVDQAQHDLLRQRVDPSSSGGGTPTFLALNGGYKLLENLIVSPPLRKNGHEVKVAVLMTDGVPNGGSVEATQCVDAASQEWLTMKPKGPIATYVVGIGAFPPNGGDGSDPTFLGGLAQAGGTGPAGCVPLETQNIANLCYYQVATNGSSIGQMTQAFVDAINAIQARASTCEFDLPTINNPDQFYVVLTDGANVEHLVPQDPTGGWSFDNPTQPTRLTLNGSSCAALRSDPKEKVRFLVDCKRY